jgi:putative transposase
VQVRRLLEEVTRRVESEMVEDILNGKLKTERVKCRFCGSDDIWKYGKNRLGIQRYKCPSCKKVFLDVDALPKMHVATRQLGDIMGQYYGGMSYKEIRRQFKQQHNVEMSRSSFHRWLTKFTKIAVDEANKYHPKVGDKWIADECVLKIGGNNVWCWDIIDSDTRFLLATHLSTSRRTLDAKALIEKAVKVAAKFPKLVLTDSLQAYIDGIELVCGSETTHIQSQPFTEADLSTNLIERWHSTLKSRMEIMRGLKSIETAQALLDGWLVHYNYFRPHESLNDRTPGEVAGVAKEFPYKDWLGVIEGQRFLIDTESLPEQEHRQPIRRAKSTHRSKRGFRKDTNIGIRQIRR